MDWIPLLAVLAWLSSVVSLAIAWVGWRRRYLLLSEGVWFVLANLSAALWTWAYGATLLVHDPRAFYPLLILRNNAASLTALFFFATVLSASRPHLRRHLYVFTALSAAIQLTSEWLTWPYWALQPMLFNQRRVWVAVLRDPPWYLSLLGTWWPMLLFLIGLVLMVAYVRPLFRQMPWWRKLAASLWILLVLGIQVWTLVPGSPLELKVVQVLPLSMWLLSLLLSTGLLRLRFGFLGAFTPEGVLGQVREGVVVVTTDGMMTWWNDIAARELGLRPEDRGLPLRERLAGHPLSEWLQREDRLRAEPLTFTDAQGQIRDWLVSWAPMEDAGGAVLGHVLIFDDLTAERAMQRTLHMRLQIQNLLRDLFALLLEDMPPAALTAQALAYIMRPLGATQPVQGAVYLVVDDPRVESGRGWRRYAWSGNLTPPPETLPYPTGEPWNEAHFWAAYVQAGGIPDTQEMRSHVWPLEDEGRLLGALCLTYPRAQALPLEVQRALETAVQILTHLVQHQRSQARLLQMQQVYESMQEAVLIHDARGRILDCNPAAEELLGFAYDRLLGHLPDSLGLVLLEPDGATLAQHMARFPMWRGRVRMRDTRAGRERIFATSIVRIRTPYSEPQLRMVSVLREVTEEVRLQRALQREREYFAQLVEVSRMMLSAALTYDQVLHHALQVTVRLSDADGATLIVVNEDLSARAVYSLEGVREDHADLAQAVLTRGAAGHALRSKRTLRLLDTHESEVWLQDDRVTQWRSALVVPLFHQERALGVLTLTHRQPGHFTDEHERLVTGAAELVALALHNALLYEEQFRLGQELLEAKERAETLQRRQEQFFANLSHEMRTPLQAILGYVDVLRMEHPEWAASFSDLDAIAEAARELLDLVNQMLDFQRSRYHGMEVYVRDVSVPEVVSSVTGVLKPLLTRNRNRLSLQIQPPNLAMRTDPDKLRRILLNLLSNAAKFTEAGEITLDIAQVTRDGEEWVRIQVRDTGVGIPEDKLETIFEPFEQAAPFRAGGTGLGLYLVKDFATRLGGWVEVESQVGQGSVFTVWLPRETEAEVHETAHLRSSD